MLSGSFIYAAISDDAKKAIKQYAGYSELQKRGFKIDMLNKIKTPEDLYNTLLPYMIVDGKPLDNLISFNGFNFSRHKTIHFQDVYGTIGELLDKGYKPEQLFYYPSKGKEIYRIGEFVWEETTPVPSIWNEALYYEKPFMGKKIAYFFAGTIIDNHFMPYIKEIQKKDAIIVDLRLYSGGYGYQLYTLGEALCSANYQGKVIFIIDRTTSDESSIENAIRQEYYINGTQKKVKFEWITVGENTAGKLAYANNAKWNYSVGELNFSPLPVNKNEWTTLEEGVGYLPEFWAVGEDDINKTIEYLTGEADFAELIKPVTQWRNYLCSSGEKALWNWSFKLPDSIKKIKSYDEYNKTVTELLKINIEYNSLINENREILNHFDWYFEMPDCATKTTKKVEDFTVPYKKVMALKIKWIQYLLENSEIFEKSNCWFEYPKVFTDCKSFSVYADCFEKWLNSRFAWCDLYVNNFEAMNRNATWWAFPDFFKSFKTAEQYCDYFCRWLDLRIWWCEVIINNEYVFHHNNIPIWYDALKEEIKEWKDPEKHLAELTAYLKNLKPWIEYLQPHPYVIPKDRGIANLYSTIRRTSEKIGKNCNAVPEEITKLQKTDPETYVDKMIAYINEFAENDFEKIKMVFDIEQEILTYDYATYQNDLAKIEKAKKGVGENYEQYQTNMNELNKNQTEERAKQDWKSVLENGTCVCEGYSRLMQYFCYKLGLKCDVISNPQDMIFVPGHAWNIVQINGEDYLIDATWGPSYLFMEPNEFLKAGHFPFEPEQQLLAQPMTLDEYKQLKSYQGNVN